MTLSKWSAWCRSAAENPHTGFVTFSARLYGHSDPAEAGTRPLTLEAETQREMDTDSRFQSVFVIQPGRQFAGLVDTTSNVIPASRFEGHFASRPRLASEVKSVGVIIQTNDRHPLAV